MVKPTLVGFFKQKIKGSSMTSKIIGWLFGLISIVFIGDYFDNGQIFAGIICGFAAVSFIPPLINKINNSAEKAAKEKGKTCKKLTPTASIISGLVLFFIAAVVGVVGGEAKQAEPLKIVSEIDQVEWYSYDGGNLMGKGALDWQKAPYQQKLATSANIIAHFWQNKKLTPMVMNELNNMDDLKPFAHTLVESLDEVFEIKESTEENEKMFTNQTVNESAIILMTLSKWI